MTATYSYMGYLSVFILNQLCEASVSRFPTVTNCFNYTEKLIVKFDFKLGVISELRD